jgi:hypothetical protein
MYKRLPETNRALTWIIVSDFVNPLLLSVRSGSVISRLELMDTML